MADSERAPLLEAGEGSHPVEHDVKALPDPKQVTLVARKIRHLIAELIPVQVKESHITTPRGHIITPAVLDLVDRAGEELPGCVVYCCLYVCRYFRRLCLSNLPDADVNEIRALACEVIAKQLLERQEDQDFLFSECLLRRYSILQGGEPSDPKSAVELAIDYHIPRVIASSAADEAIRKIWIGEASVKYAEDDSMQFALTHPQPRRSFWHAFRVERATVPRYQNAVQILLSLVFLILYSISVNTANRSGEFDAVEAVFYLFVAGYLADDLTKIFKVGYSYVSFWIGVNLLTWSFFVASAVLRCIALTSPMGQDAKDRLIVNSYRLLATAAPLVYTRLLLYADANKFVGVMIIVTKVLLQESVIFVALAALMVAGFVQAFLGFDASDGSLDRVDAILHAITQATLGSATFDQFEGWPLIIYYVFSFVMSVVLLNILVALFNEAYANIYENATDEWLTLRARKTVQFVRAPDENVFIPPFNLVEIVVLVPLELVLSRQRYQSLNRAVLTTLYSPYLACIALFERIYLARGAKEEPSEDFDDDVLHDEPDGRAWIQTCEQELPPLENALDVVKQVRKQLGSGTSGGKGGAGGAGGTENVQSMRSKDDGQGDGDEVVELRELIARLSKLAVELERKLERTS